eukprot:1155102-Pelagomonas_calceolata.AAC.5
MDENVPPHLGFLGVGGTLEQYAARQQCHLALVLCTPAEQKKGGTPGARIFKAGDCQAAMMARHNGG